MYVPTRWFDRAPSSSSRTRSFDNSPCLSRTTSSQETSCRKTLHRINGHLTSNRVKACFQNMFCQGNLHEEIRHAERTGNRMQMLIHPQRNHGIPSPMYRQYRRAVRRGVRGARGVPVIVLRRVGGQNPPEQLLQAPTGAVHIVLPLGCPVKVRHAPNRGRTRPVRDDAREVSPRNRTRDASSPSPSAPIPDVT